MNSFVYIKQFRASLLSPHRSNNLYRTANPISVSYRGDTDTTTYLLTEDYSLHIQGTYTEPCGRLLNPYLYKLLDILVCGLETASLEYPYQSVLSLDDFIELLGYKLSKSNRNTIRPQVKEYLALLEAISLSWTEADEYRYDNVKIFEWICFEGANIYATFTDEMANYLLARPILNLPYSLLRIGNKLSHSYGLGRRCLLHQAINKGRDRQAIQVEKLLAVCPRIPRPGPDENYSPSVLTRKVISPFVSAMNSLAEHWILQWNFRTSKRYDNYQEFANSIVEFSVLSGSQSVVQAQNKNAAGTSCQADDTPVVFPFSEFIERCKAKCFI